MLSGTKRIGANVSLDLALCPRSTVLGWNRCSELLGPPPAPKTLRKYDAASTRERRGSSAGRFGVIRAGTPVYCAPDSAGREAKSCRARGCRSQTQGSRWSSSLAHSVRGIAGALPWAVQPAFAPRSNTKVGMPMTRNTRPNQPQLMGDASADRPHEPDCDVEIGLPERRAYYLT